MKIGTTLVFAGLFALSVPVRALADEHEAQHAAAAQGHSDPTPGDHAAEGGEHVQAAEDRLGDVTVPARPAEADRVAHPVAPHP